MTDVIVTGIPRSGLTLVAALIDGLPNAMCLNSPAMHSELVRQATDSICYGKLLAGDFLWTRAQIIDKQPVYDFRSLSGAPLVDGLHDPKMPLKASSGEPSAIPLTRNLTGDFILGAKHHTLYTSVLPTLVKFRHFKIIAVIRHPLDVFASWKQLPKPLLAKGNPKGIGRFWPEALGIASSGANMATLFAQLYDLYLQRYHELREHIHIVKYEDIIEDPAMVSRLFGLKKPPSTASLIEARPRRQFLATETESFRAALKKYGVYTKIYYDGF